MRRFSSSVVSPDFYSGTALSDAVFAAVFGGLSVKQRSARGAMFDTERAFCCR
jgi:hypothetical protein